MSRPTRRQVYQPSPHYAVVPQSPQSPPRTHSYNAYSYQAPQPHGFQPYDTPIPQPQFQIPPHQQAYAQPISDPRPIRSNSSSSNHRNTWQPARAPSANSTRRSSRQQQPQQPPNGRNAMARGVATGDIGAGYGPYSYHPDQARETGVYRNNSRFSNSIPSSETSVHVTQPPTREKGPPPVLTTTTVPQYMWDKDPEVDDALHHPDPPGYFDFTIFSCRGWINAFTIFAIIAALLTLFIGYPVLYDQTHKPAKFNGFNAGGINGTGQIPLLPNLPQLIDRDTPSSVFTRTGSDGMLYDLVFSDEFNTDGRSFYPGDDPFWEAVDLHYWPTGDAEWYDPSAVTTQGGNLVITMTEQQVHDLDFQSGMLSSWNKFCYTTGYVEVSVSLPGKPDTPGLWPGAWSLGNLGRAGYGATTEGTWPYSYAACDVGTLPNQTDASGNPAAAVTGGLGGTALSFQPGQKLSACTCPGQDHPGPSVTVGRGVPEIDILEARIDTARRQGQVSQSYQCAPYDIGYNWDQSSPATTVYNSTMTIINTYQGGPLQEAVSAETYVEDQFYGGNAFAPYAYEYWSDPNNRDDGYITWFSNGEKTWTMTSATIGPDSQANISQRLISEEPMYLILNLAMSSSFQAPDFAHLQFPAQMLVDYVRVYQRRGIKNGVGCNPPNRPTTDYINRHMLAYTNANLTTWFNATNLTFPKNSLQEPCH